MIKLIRKYLKEFTLPAIFAPIMIILEVLLELMIPRQMTNIVDVGIANSNIGYITKIGLLMIGLAVLSLVCGALSGRFAAKAASGFARNVRQALFYKISDFSFYNVDKFSSASLLTRSTTDITLVQNAFMMCLRILFRAPIMLVGAAIMVFTINSRLALIFAVVVPLIAITFGFLLSKAHPLFRKLMTKYDALNASVQENLIAMRVVKAFVREDYEKGKFENSAEMLRAAQIKAEKIIIFAMPVLMFAIYACMIGITWFGGNFIIEGSMTTGDLLSFISYVMNILMSLMMVSFIFLGLVMSRASIQRINEVLDEEIDIRDDEQSAENTVQDGSVVFEDVSFSYSKDINKLTLEHATFEIRPGEMIGIIGGTGSSKTTLVQLIPRLYDVTAGRILVGGRDVRDYKLENLRDEVAMVLQKNVLFSGTIKENLKWGNPDATDEEVIEAAKAAQAHDFIMSFPDQYDTELGQGGVNVSGGQKQRLCIARALMKKPKIIILDDSTSAVDTATDAAIRAAFRKQLKGTTAIIIAQRIDSVKDTDRIIVLDEGKINAIGTHETLLKENQIYREVYESQKKGAEL